MVLQSGADDPQILIESTGDYFETIELPPAGNYIVVEGDDFTGSIKLEIKQKGVHNGAGVGISMMPP